MIGYPLISSISLIARILQITIQKSLPKELHSRGFIYNRNNNLDKNVDIIEDDLLYIEKYINIIIQ